MLHQDVVQISGVAGDDGEDVVMCREADLHEV